MVYDPKAGKTLHQMKRSPRHAFYVWRSVASIEFGRALAKSLGRDDLRVIPPEDVKFATFRGIRDAAIVVDHATFVSKNMIKVIAWVREGMHLLPTAN